MPLQIIGQTPAIRGTSACVRVNVRVRLETSV